MYLFIVNLSQNILYVCAKYIFGDTKIGEKKISTDFVRVVRDFDEISASGDGDVSSVFFC